MRSTDCEPAGTVCVCLIRLGGEFILLGGEGVKGGKKKKERRSLTVRLDDSYFVAFANSDFTTAGGLVGVEHFSSLFYWVGSDGAVDFAVGLVNGHFANILCGWRCDDAIASGGRWFAGGRLRMRSFGAGLIICWSDRKTGNGSIRAGNVPRAERIEGVAPAERWQLRDAIRGFTVGLRGRSMKGLLTL